MAFSIESNTEPGLVTPTIGADSALDLSFVAEASGTATITVRATDSGALTVDDVFTVTVSAVNDAPTVAAAIPDTTVYEDSPLIDNYRDLTAVFTDVEDGSALTFTIQSNTNPGLVTPTIGADSALDLSVAANASGSATITVRASDGSWTVENAFTVTVTVVPEVAVTPTTTTASRLPSNGTNYTVDFTVTNNGSGADGYDLLTTQSPGTALTVVSITGTGVTQGADPDSARVANLAGGGSTVVTVTYSVADVAAGSTDTLIVTARSVADPAATGDGRLELTVIRPSITTAKAVNSSGPEVPGTDLTYTLTVTNVGSADAVGVVIVDSLAAEVQFKVGSVVNNLPAGISVVVEYSDNDGSSWTYVPVSGGCNAPAGYDACVNRVRWTLQNDLSSIAPDNTGDVRWVARIN